MSTSRNFVLCVALALVGCGEQSVQPAVTYIDIGVDEECHPAGIAVMVENPGDEPARLVSASANVGWKYLITGKVPVETLPAEFDYELQTNAPPDIAVPAKNRETITFDFVWNTGPDPPPMLAIVHARLVLTFDDGQSLETLPVAFVVHSCPDVVIGQPLGERGSELAAKIASLPGWKSPAVTAIMAAAE